MDSNFTDKYMPESENVNLFDYVALRAENFRNFSLSIVLKNRDKGLFEQLCDMLMDVLKEIKR